jgi:hypothetical protein
MAAEWPSGCYFGAHAWDGVGVRPLLCGHHGCQLEIPLYPTHRFLNFDYSVFDCSGMAFREAGFHASVATVGVRIPTAVSVLRGTHVLSLPFRDARSLVRPRRCRRFTAAEESLEAMARRARLKADLSLNSLKAQLASWT